MSLGRPRRPCYPEPAWCCACLNLIKLIQCMYVCAITSSMDVSHCHSWVAASISCSSFSLLSVTGTSFLDVSSAPIFGQNFVNEHRWCHDRSNSIVVVGITVLHSDNASESVDEIWRRMITIVSCQILWIHEYLLAASGISMYLDWRQPTSTPARMWPAKAWRAVVATEDGRQSNHANGVWAWTSKRTRQKRNGHFNS